MRYIVGIAASVKSCCVIEYNSYEISHI